MKEKTMLVENSESLEEIQKKRDYQLQSNEISNGIYSCTPMARRLIGFCISHAYDDTVKLYQLKNKNIQLKDFKLETVSFSIGEFITKMGMNKGANTYEKIRQAIDECSRARICIESTTEAFDAYTWFIHAKYNLKKDKIEMLFNPLIYKAIVEWYFTNKGYSALNLEILGDLHSFYSMRYYEMAISQMGNCGKNGNKPNEWFFEWTVNELRTLFEIKETAYKDRMDRFIIKVVIEPIDELNLKNKEFQIEVMKIKEKRKTTGFRFLCSKCVGEKRITKDDTYEDKQAKAEYNKNKRDIEFYKKKYSKLWDMVYSEVKSKELSSFTIVNEVETVKEIKEMLNVN